MTELASPSGTLDHAGHMDRMYRYTRHVYDASRKYYLLGRDELLRRMAIRSGDLVLEMGCGTARNLIALHSQRPAARLYGLDASTSMLQTAQRSIDRKGIAASITLRHSYAESLHHRQTFDLDRPFDVIFFSYSLSMMPTWPQAIDAALRNLMPGGRIYIVDFWDQADLPTFFAAGLKRWLSLFHVHYRPELMQHLLTLEKQGRIELDVLPMYRRYAYIATIAPANQ